MKTNFALALVGTCLGISLPVAAAEAGCGGDGVAMVTRLFEAADRDGNGALSPDEYEAAQLERYGVSFGESDLDGSGSTSLEEYLDLYRHHHRVDGETDA